MKILLFIFLSLSFLVPYAQAETINLKDGRSVSGKIKQKDNSQVVIEVNGLEMTYYSDEIKDIDGKPMVPPAVVPPSPVATAAPKAPEAPVVKSPEAPAIAVAKPVEVKEDPAQKRALILKFIEVFGTRTAMQRNFDAMLNSLAQQKPEEALKIRERFKIDEVIERLIPLYDKYFTSEDLKTYIDFYSSEKGQKLIKSIGLIMKDSIQVGAAYLKEKFPELAGNQ